MLRFKPWTTATSRRRDWLTATRVAGREDYP